MDVAVEMVAGLVNSVLALGITTATQHVAEHIIMWCSKDVCSQHLTVAVYWKEQIVQVWEVQGGSNMTGTDLYVNKPHCAAAVRP